MRQNVTNSRVSGPGIGSKYGSKRESGHFFANRVTPLTRFNRNNGAGFSRIGSFGSFGSTVHTPNGVFKQHTPYRGRV